MTDEPFTPCAACESGKASFILPSGAPVCGDCYMTLGHPEAVPLTEPEPSEDLVTNSGAP